MLNATKRFERRKRRVRFALQVTGHARPRLSVYRSGRHIYCQVIDDVAGHTVAAASTVDTSVKGELKSGADREAARRVGMLVAERAKAAGIETVKFDRGGYRFHGRVKALADGAREGGLLF